jgi:signal transduction histidine kinase
MFYRTSDKSSGSGLGLYIVKETIKKLGGTVDVWSEINSGTTFTLTIPITEDVLNY